MFKQTKIFKYSILLLLFFTVLPGCSKSQSEVLDTLDKTTEPYPSQTTTHTETYIPTKPSTEKPTVTPQLIFKPENFDFPVTFDGPYALGHPLSYAPCYHWNGSHEVVSGNWYDLFHAGDMHMLNLSNVSQPIVVLAPTTGNITRIDDIGENGLMVTIKTDYFLDGKRIYVDIGHMHRIFPGDEFNPKITNGTHVIQGQPIGVSDMLFQWGRSEQSVDIGIRNGPEGANPEYNNFAPNSYIDPYFFLADDIPILEERGLIKYDYFRDHCLQSGHFP